MSDRNAWFHYRYIRVGERRSAWQALTLSRRQRVWLWPVRWPGWAIVALGVIYVIAAIRIDEPLLRLMTPVFLAALFVIGYLRAEEAPYRQYPKGDLRNSQNGSTE
jgi:hypothetical protein